MNKVLLACLAAAGLVLPATAQNCGFPGVTVSVSPQPAAPWEQVHFTLTNNSNEPVSVTCGKLFTFLYAGPSCSGAPVYIDGCVTPFFASVAPGASLTQSWDQLDAGGQPVPDGVYSVAVGYQGGGVWFQCCLSFAICGASSPATTYCTAGTSASGCTAQLASFGTPSSSLGAGFVVQASGVEKGKEGLFFYGQGGRQAVPWGNGTSYQCLAPPVKRGGLLKAQTFPGTCSGVFAQDLNARWCAGCPRPGHAPAAGQKLQIQFWYRDGLNTSNQTTSRSDALEAHVCP